MASKETSMTGRLSRFNPTDGISGILFTGSPRIFGAVYRLEDSKWLTFHKDHYHHSVSAETHKLVEACNSHRFLFPNLEHYQNE